MVQLLIPFRFIYGTIDNIDAERDWNLVSFMATLHVALEVIKILIILCDRGTRCESEVVAAVVCFLPLVYLLQAKTSSKSLGQNTCSWRLQCLLDPEPEGLQLVSSIGWVVWMCGVAMLRYLFIALM